MEEGSPEEANAIGDRRKTTETADSGSRQNSKPRIPTNQITALPAPARALPASFCGVYKASPFVPKSFGLSFSSGEVKVR